MGKEGAYIMNEGVKILLARMETYPDEFLVEGMHISSKWGNLIAEYLESLDPEDANTLKAGLNKIKQQRFTEKVMKELLAPEDDSLGKPWYTTRAKGTPLAGTTQGLYANGIGGNATLIEAQKYQMEQMKLHLDAHREAIKTTPIKKHKTLFGKLFNYQ